MASALDRLEHVHAEDRAAWRAWLVEHHRTARGAWLVSWKAATGRPRIPYDDAVEEALCVGWVDSRPGTVDEERTRLLFTPRKRGSGWSRPNKERIARLVAAGLMLPAGTAVVEAAVADGSWSALDDVENLVEPPELAAALDADPRAREHWDAFPRSAKRAILEWISTAKRPETRATRIAETARLAAENVRANQWRPKG
jgi:uncharacterized protein YdeI (YjbR/CyaY-like superfamily)